MREYERLEEGRKFMLRRDNLESYAWMAVSLAAWLIIGVMFGMGWL